MGKKTTNKATLKHLEDLISLIPPSPTSFRMGVPPSFVHVNQQAQEHPYVVVPLLSHDKSSKFDMKVLPIHFMKMFDDINWDIGIMSLPLKKLCYFFIKAVSHDFKNDLFFLIAFNVHVI